MREKVEKVIIKNIPNISIRVIDKNDDKYLTRNKKKYPFILENDVNFLVKTSRREFEFQIFEGFVWNGADIPKIFFFIGQSKDNNYLVASMVHDYLIEYKHFIRKHILKEQVSMKEYRRLTSLIFREILKDHKTNVVKANIMGFAVDFFQMTFCAKNWRCKKCK
ncbi:MAG: DUF1353 domain-containing protein [Cyanobacteria bacterium SIG30]|nr:DUF1353 domain-containing protein [Cyanobacteria bacterium SIG30]